MAPLFSLETTTEEALRKLFVGGLNRNTTDESLKAYFLSFGAVTDSVVIKSEQKTSRGFGFVTYETIEATDLCISSKPHNIDGKDLEVKRAIPRDNNGPTAHLRTKKIFVGGLPQISTKELLEELFNSNEDLKVKVTADVIMDKVTEKCKGFGFLECEDEDMADKLSIIRKFNINDKQVELKKAEPKEPGRGGMQGGRGRGGQGGGGGGRGRGYNNYGGDSYGGGYDSNDYYGNSYNNSGYNGAGGWDNYQGGGSGYWDQAGYGQSSYGGGGAAYGGGYAAGGAGGGGGGGGNGYQGGMNQGRGNRGTSRGGRYRPY